MAAGREFDRRAGLAEDLVAARAERGNLYRRRVSDPPSRFRRLRHGDRLEVGRTEWRVIVGQGHAPEMLCLYARGPNVLIAADQILPKISPVVGVWPAEPEANPLAEFLASLGRFRELPDDCLVLPSHGQPVSRPARPDRSADPAPRGAARGDALGLRGAGYGGRGHAAPVQPAARHAINLQFALGESLAHLNYLLAEGRLQRRLDDDGRFRYATR